MVSRRPCYSILLVALVLATQAHGQSAEPNAEQDRLKPGQRWDAGADVLQLEPRLATGLSYYELELDGDIEANGAVVNGVKFNDYLYLAGVGLTAKYGKMFFDVYGQASLDGNEDISLDIDSPNQSIQGISQDVDFDRYEVLATLGYQFTNRFALFAGYKYADVEFDGNGSLSGVSAEFTTDFEQHGGFVGSGYALPAGVLDSVFVFNTAVSYLFGNVDNKFAARPLVDSIDFEIDGKAIGFNGGVNWVAPITDQLKLVIGADASRYSFDDDKNNTDFDETIARFRSELRYSFDTSAGWKGKF